MREHVTCSIHDSNDGFLVLNADVNVHPEDKKRTGRMLQFFDQLNVSFVLEDFLVGPIREWMSGSGQDCEAFATGQFSNYPAKPGNIGPRFVDVSAYHRPDLDHRLVHFGLN